MKNIWIIAGTLIIATILIATFIILATMKGRRGTDNHGNPTRYPLGKMARRLRNVGMSATALLLVATLVGSTVLANGGLDNFLSLFVSAQEGDKSGENPDATGSGNTQAGSQELEIKVAIDDVVHPGLDLSQEELDVLTAGLEFYVGRQSMTSWLPIRNELCGFQNAVSIPLTLMYLDYDYVEELHGRSRTNPDLKAVPTADVLKAIHEKLEEWQKLYADLPDDERNQALKEAIKQEITTNVIFADMVLQFFCTQKYYTENNQWLLEGKDMLDQAYAEPNGLWSLCEYEEGYDENSDCASAHIVYRNDIMERKINSVKEAEKQAAEEQKADGTTTNDGDDAIDNSADDQEEKEYYSFGYRTLTQMLVALIDDTTPVGVCKGMTTVENYYLVEAANPSFTRTALSPYQESEDVFLLQVIDKSGRVVLSYGFNMKDRRVGLYDRTDKPNVMHDPNLNVKYLEEGTDNELASPKTTYVVPQTKFTEDPKDLGDNWICINPDAGKDKVMPEEGMTIIFYYRAKQQETKTLTYLLTVICKDEASGQQFDSFSLGRFEAGKTVTIPHKDYEGREFVSGPSSCIMPAKDHTVILTYRQTSTPPPGDGEGSKNPEADPENKPKNDHGIGDNDDPGVGSNFVNSEDEAKSDVNNSEEQQAFDDQTKKDEEEAANQGKGDSSGTGGEDHKVIDPDVPEENHQNNTPPSTEITKPKDEETVIDETETVDENGNVTKEEQESDASEETNNVVIGEPE